MIETTPSRRGFLKLVGMGVGVAATAPYVKLLPVAAAPVVEAAPVVAVAASGSQFIGAQEYANIMLKLVKENLMMAQYVVKQ